MKISKGTVFGEVEYTQNEDGFWSFRLTLDDDPVPIESDWTFPSKELAEEQVNYTLDSAGFANRGGLSAQCDRRFEILLLAAMISDNVRHRAGERR